MAISAETKRPPTIAAHDARQVRCALTEQSLFGFFGGTKVPAEAAEQRRGDPEHQRPPQPVATVARRVRRRARCRGLAAAVPEREPVCAARQRRGSSKAISCGYGRKRKRSRATAWRRPYLLLRGFKRHGAATRPHTPSGRVPCRDALVKLQALYM